MIAENITIEWDEDGCYLRIPDPDAGHGKHHQAAYHFRVLDPEQLYDRVKAAIGPWLQEHDAARSEYVVAIREDGSYRVEPDEDAYDPTDPKHPRFHSVHADLWDSREGK